MAEADRLADGHRWRAATRVLTAAADGAEGEERRPVLERLAVTAADGGRHGTSREAVYELSRLGPHTPATWVAFANVALARGNHLHADRAARAALQDDPADHGAWTALSAGYAGLGWFDEAGACLDRLDRASLSERDRWRIGRAVNRWALGGTAWLILVVAAIPLLGVGVAALAVAGPPLVRRWRLDRLAAVGVGPELVEMARSAWRRAIGLRIAYGVVIGVASAAALLPHLLR